MTFLHQTKPIRELRMGPPKCWKTGSVLETYPLPLLCLQFDQDGCDVVTKRRVLKIKPDELKIFLSKPADDILKLADIIEIPFYSLCRPQVTDDWTPQKNMETFKRIMWSINDLTPWTALPFKTVVGDGVSRLQEFMLQYMPGSSGGTEKLNDPRKWASSVGGKCLQVISTLYGLPCHVVILCHVDEAEKNPVTDKIKAMPLLYGTRARYEVGGLPSQFFLQKMSSGKPRLITKDMMAVGDYVSGLGARWPQNLPAELDPTFQAIYETEYKQ